MNKKLFLLLILGVLFSVSAYAEECSAPTFKDRIISSCKIPDNGVCDDGENFLLDNECMVAAEDLRTGDIFKNMWLIRLVLLIILFMLIRKSDNTPIMMLLFLALLAINGAFGTLAHPGQIISEPPLCDKDNFLKNINACIWPSNPTMGWVAIIVFLFILFQWRRSRIGQKDYKSKYS